MSQTALQPSPKLNPSFEMDFELDPPPTPVQVREWVADLFRQDRINLAIALAEAGLALYPDSEDVLVIAALVSEVQQDWAYSRQLLEHLIKIQAGNTPAEVWHHYAGSPLALMTYEEGGPMVTKMLGTDLAAGNEDMAGRGLQQFTDHLQDRRLAAA